MTSQQPITATEFVSYVRSRFVWVVASVITGAMTLVLVLAISSNSRAIPEPGSSKLGETSTDVFEVGGFSTTRQVLALADVSEDAINKLFFPAASDIAEALGIGQGSSASEPILKSCDLAVRDATISFQCQKNTVFPADILLVSQKIYDSIFYQRMRPIAESLNRIRLVDPSEKLEVVTILVSTPAKLQVTSKSEHQASPNANDGSIGAISFSLRNALVLGIGGGLVGMFAVLLVLLVLMTRSGAIHSIKGLDLIVDDQAMVLDLTHNGPELAALEISDVAKRQNSEGIAIIPINETQAPPYLLEILGRFSVTPETFLILGTCEEQIEKLPKLTPSFVVLVCTIEKTKEVDLRRLLRACELNAKLTVGLVAAKKA